MKIFLYLYKIPPHPSSFCTKSVFICSFFAKNHTIRKKEILIYKLKKKWRKDIVEDGVPQIIGFC